VVETTERTAYLARRRGLIARLVAAALCLTVVVIALAYWWSNRGEERLLVAPRTLPKEVNQQLSGYTFTRSDEGRQVFTIHAARTVAFGEGGATVLEDVYVEVFGKTGQRRDILRTRSCEYNAKSGDLFSAGKVEIELNAPPEGTKGMVDRSVHLETSKLSFQQKGSLVTSAEPVQFRIGPVSGSALGMAYATREGWLELKNNVNAEVPLHAGEEPSPPLHLTAARARYEKEQGEIELGGPVEFSQEGRRVVADQGTVYLDRENHIRRAVLEEGVRVSESSQGGALQGAADRLQAEFDPPSGELRQVVAEGAVTVSSRRDASVGHLEAQQVEVNFEGEPPRAQRGAASGAVRLSFDSPRNPGQAAVTAGDLPPGRRELTAAEVEFTFQPQGHSLAEAQTVGAGKLVLVPFDPQVGQRVVSAGQFVMAFGPRNGLQGIRGDFGTEIDFFPPPGAGKEEPARSTAKHLEATFDPGTQELRTIRQFQDFRFREGDRQGTAQEAWYSSSGETLILTGAPQLRDATTRVQADRIELNLRTDTAEGIGSVRSAHFEDAASHPEPTNVLADRVVAMRKSEYLHYEGHVRAWRGADVVESSALDVYRRERRVSSGVGVRTSFLQPAPPDSGATPAKSKIENRPVTIQADRLEYLDQGRKASYRGNVRLLSEDTTLEADRVDVYFRGESGGRGAEVERAVAEGHVRVRQPARLATGDHAEYFAAEGKILLTGGPPTLRDEQRGFTTGQRLTFFIRDDTLLVDGGDESRTVSKHRITE
jgi:lipopolysaccharide export system protein LptA